MNLINFELNLNIDGSTLDKAKDLIKLITPNFVNKFSEFYTERVKFWRIKYQVNILAKVKEFINKHSLSTNSVPLKFLFPLLNDCFVEID